MKYKYENARFVTLTIDDQLYFHVVNVRRMSKLLSLVTIADIINAVAGRA